MPCNTIFIRNLGDVSSQPQLIAELQQITDGFIGLKITKHRVNKLTMCFAEYHDTTAAAKAIARVEGHRFSFMRAEGPACLASFGTRSLNFNAGGKESGSKPSTQKQPKQAALPKQAPAAAPEEGGSMTIPEEAAGRVIGRKGAQLRTISAKTGSGVRVEPGSDDGLRTVTFNGQLSQIAAARQMVAKIVEEFSEGAAELGTQQPQQQQQQSQKQKPQQQQQQQQPQKQKGGSTEDMLAANAEAPVVVQSINRITVPAVPEQQARQAAQQYQAAQEQQRQAAMAAQYAAQQQHQAAQYAAQQQHAAMQHAAMQQHAAQQHAAQGHTVQGQQAAQRQHQAAQHAQQHAAAQQQHAAQGHGAQRSAQQQHAAMHQQAQQQAALQQQAQQHAAQQQAAQQQQQQQQQAAQAAQQAQQQAAQQAAQHAAQHAAQVAAPAEEAKKSKKKPKKPKKPKPTTINSTEPAPAEQAKPKPKSKQPKRKDSKDSTAAAAPEQSAAAEETKEEEEQGPCIEALLAEMSAQGYGGAPTRNIERLTQHNFDVAATVAAIQAERDAYAASLMQAVELPPMKPPTYQVGTTTKKGRGHPSNEDRFVVCDLKPAQGWSEGTAVKLFAVIDGHGGPVVSEMLSKALPGVLSDALCSGLAMPEALKATYKVLEERCEELHSTVGETSGAVAVTVAVQGLEMWIAHVGDCRAVIASGIDEHTGQPAAKLQVEDLTRDHRAHVPEEAARIQAAGGRIGSDGRVLGVLIPSRTCLLYTSPSPRDRTRSRMPSSA
eukprot:TRINITY_DN3287_c0_g1_i6.p1 TRINITY_DN3287_c0_g1~~TRINITY_DN3287_c0_g1_i6.p1  ORF type:complete len:773 (-),score=307.56 TRINITY_DN3287_c0_g1_i6:44-2362(-)